MQSKLVTKLNIRLCIQVCFYFIFLIQCKICKFRLNIQLIKLISNNDLLLLTFRILFIQKNMKRGSKILQISLPKISRHKIAPQITVNENQDYCLDEPIEQSQTQINLLDQWTARNDGSPVKKSSKTISTYRDSINRRHKKRQLTESAIVMQTKLYLLRLQNQLKKAHDINYVSIFKNIEYCSGLYQNFYNQILKTLDRLKASLQKRYNTIEESIKNQRIMHINNMEKSQTYRDKIPSVRYALQLKELQLQPIKNLIENIQNSKIFVLKNCLHVGYDVREEGLIWIAKQLKNFPKKQEFPPFLNDREINFIKSNFEKDLLSNKNNEEENAQFLTKTLQKSPKQIYQIVERKKKRELSMIRQDQIFKQIKIDSNIRLQTERHKYLTPDILKMASEQLPKTKATKYQIIYRQTLKRLNKFCINQIYKKTTKKQKNIVEGKRESLNTIKVLSYFQNKIQDYLHKANESHTTKNEDQRQLYQIIRSLRYESYQQSMMSDRNIRNPVSILCCLVGWRKAKRIVEQQLNYQF